MEWRTIPRIPGGAKLEEHVTLHFPARGIYRENAVVFSTGFPFGFTERKALVPLRQQILVYPSVQPRPEFDHLLTELSGEVESHFRGRGHDFIGFVPNRVRECSPRGLEGQCAHRRPPGPGIHEGRRTGGHLPGSRMRSPGAVFETIVDCVPAWSGISPSTAGT